VSHEATFRAHQVASTFYRRQLLGNPRSWAARHLDGRQLGAVLAADSTWSVGYASDRWTGLVDHLRAEGFDDETMLAAGLARPTRSGYLIDRSAIDSPSLPMTSSCDPLASLPGPGQRSRGT
jgi:DNA primase